MQRAEGERAVVLTEGQKLVFKSQWQKKWQVGGVDQGWSRVREEVKDEVREAGQETGA